MRARIALVGITAALSLLLAGCGGSGSSNTENLPKSAADAGGMDALVSKAKRRAR